MSDLRTREVSDLVWAVFGTLGTIMNIFEIITGSVNILNLAMPILVSTAISFALGYLGLFGGADFKAFVVLSLLQPLQPDLIKPMLDTTSVIFPLTVFSNSAGAGASFALIMLVRNLFATRRGWALFEDYESVSPFKKFIILITGLKIRVDEVRGPPFQYPMETTSADAAGKRKLILMPNIEDDEAALETFNKLKEGGVTEIWVSHTLPFLVFITFGFVSALLLGDILLWLITGTLFPQP